MPIEDPQKLLKWLAKDRAAILFTDMADLVARRASLEGIVRQWIKYV